MVLKDLANANGYTLKTLAEALGIGPSYLSQINTGRRKPGVKLCRRIETVTNGGITGQQLRPEWFRENQ
jgi:DNA-binding transcriptional regulator YdaS (Cro superfamily)